MRSLSDIRALTKRQPAVVGEVLPAEREQNVLYVGAAYDPQPVITSEKEPIPMTFEGSFVVPAAQAWLTALSVATAAGVLAIINGWSWHTVALAYAGTLLLAWCRRLAASDERGWRTTSYHVPGAPMTRAGTRYALANARVARETLVQEGDADAESKERQDLQAFVDRCYVVGCSESSHGVKASGPDREHYTAARDALMALGCARWKNPERPKAGWVMCCSRMRARSIIDAHVM